MTVAEGRKHRKWGKDGEVIRCPDCGSPGNYLNENYGNRVGNMKSPPVGTTLLMCSNPECFLIFDQHRKVWTLDHHGNYRMGRPCPKCGTLGEYQNIPIMKCPRCQIWYNAKLQMYEFQGKHLVKVAAAATKKEVKEEKSVAKIMDELKALIPSRDRMLESLKGKTPNKLAKEIGYHHSYVYKLCEIYGITKDDWNVETENVMMIKSIETEHSEPHAQEHLDKGLSKITLRDALKLKEELDKDLNCAVRILNSPVSHLTPGVREVLEDYVAQGKDKQAKIERYFDEITLAI